MLDALSIKSHKGTYKARFTTQLLLDPDFLLEGEPHFIVDKKIAEPTKRVMDRIERESKSTRSNW